MGFGLPCSNIPTAHPGLLVVMCYQIQAVPHWAYWQVLHLLAVHGTLTIPPPPPPPPLSFDASQNMVFECVLISTKLAGSAAVADPAESGC